MNSMKWLSAVVLTILLSAAASAQNYIGFSKEYIIRAMKSQRKDMSGPVKLKDESNNFISYVSKDGKRVVYYYFKPMTVTAKSGKTQESDICWKYYSKNKCKSYTSCPEMDEIVRSLDSHMTKVGDNLWMDYSKKVPHEWVLVKDEHTFEIHVTEAKK